MKIDNQVRKNLLNWLIALGVVIMIVFCCGFSEEKPPRNYEKIEATYTVKQGDTLWDIAEVYMAKNSYGKRDIREFMQGIIELNVDKYPDIRYSHIKGGQELKINYWVAKENADMR